MPEPKSEGHEVPNRRFEAARSGLRHALDQAEGDLGIAHDELPPLEQVPDGGCGLRRWKMSQRLFGRRTYRGRSQSNLNADHRRGLGAADMRERAKCLSAGLFVGFADLIAERLLVPG